MTVPTQSLKIYVVKKQEYKFFYNGLPISREQLELLPDRVIKSFIEQAKLGRKNIKVTFKHIPHPLKSNNNANLEDLKPKAFLEKEALRLKKKQKKSRKERNNRRKSSILAEKRKQRRIERALFLSEKARNLNENPPKSEVWFWSLYEDYASEKDERNSPFLGKIPDILNKKFKYILEIDGSFHESEEQKQKDRLKDKLFSQNGYVVIRVEAFNLESFNQALRKVKILRGES